ncbi:DUF397 domain-containing protein [Actinoplanes sp. URMC 104]|uniref:DUF397 domain-containing protein n=1 Tax=Actinoplanes sp. URMC 104 TaxID=3423409 RepID=UPI003F1AF191
MTETSEWRRSSFCSDAACAEIKVEDDTVAVRSTRRPEATVEFTRAEWEAVKAAIKNDEF